LLTGLLPQSGAAFPKAVSMVFSAFRKASLTVVLLLGSAALPAQAGWFSADKSAQKEQGKASQVASPAANAAANAPSTADPSTANLPATNLDDSIRQAQLLRLAGQYPEAVKHLSQLMLLASDDARVISEYGKTLASMGRATDAVNFLTRAQQLQPGDWTLYSAMGVAYDQLGDQKNAQDAYEHALSIKPNEASVLSNYALSRMLAKDPEMARKLAARAESAGGSGDDKIARNIAMIRTLAPEQPVAPPVTVASQLGPVSVTQSPAKAPAHAAEAHDNRVVMQRVPVDPLAGPVAKPGPAPVNTATQAPRSLQSQVAAETSTAEAPALPVPKPVTFQALPPPPAPVKAAELKPAPAKTADAPKPLVATVAKPIPPATAKAAETASASVTLRLAPPLGGETDKPRQAPKVLPPVKAAAKPGVPGLRVSANAY
jgi:Flp pilus assembly protein TadD